MSAETPGHEDSSSAEPDPPDARRVIQSQELLKGESEALIEHAGEIYRLRLTSRGRLYLSK